MSDTIDRQAAIDAAAFGITYAKKINKETGEVEVLFEQSNEELRKAIDRINALPSAEPKRKKGKWIVEGEFIDCSVCRMEKWSRIPYEDLVKRFRF